jgi:predicted RNA binding protein YcfA (HicA-like mRNA interferase family)
MSIQGKNFLNECPFRRKPLLYLLHVKPLMDRQTEHNGNGGARMQPSNGRIGSLKPSQIIGALNRMGFREVKTNDGKKFLRDDRGRHIKVPITAKSKEISPNVIKNWLRHASIDENEFKANV